MAVKVTLHLQGCLAYKRCSASGLNCRYLKPHIKLKLIALAIRLYQDFWKNELSNFSRLLNASARITFWTFNVKATFVFRLLNVFLRFGAKALKKGVGDLSFSSISVKSHRTFLNWDKKDGLIVQKSLLNKKYLEIKTSQTRFVVYM